MFERFTDRARTVMALATEQAHGMNHEYIGTEHILLGLIKEASGIAAMSLKKHGVDIDIARTEVGRLVLEGPKKDEVSDKLPRMPKAKKVIENAVDQARQLDHNYIGCEHILLGLIKINDGIAVQVLNNLGIDTDQLRQDVIEKMGV